MLPTEDAVAIPALLPGRGFPAAGQTEVTDRDILMASGDLPSEDRAKLEAQLAADSSKKEAAPKSFFQQYWHLIVPAMVIYMFMSGGGGGDAGGARQGGGVGQAAPRGS